MNHASRAEARNDAALLRNTLLRLTAPHLILCAVVATAAVFLWLALGRRLLAFGRSIDYDGLQAFGAQATAMMKEYSPFFWWAIVIALTLIIAYFVVGFVQSTMRRASQRLVDAGTVGLLCQELSPAGRKVLDWAWRDRRHPITVGDLQRGAAELRTGRAGKITLAREHAALLDAQPYPVPDTELAPAHAAIDQEPVVFTKRREPGLPSSRPR